MNAPPVDGLSDIEVGAEIVSKTIYNGNYPAGGVVVGIDITADGSFEFTVLRWRSPGDTASTPYLFVFEGDDIDLPVTQLTGRGARNAAERLNAWLGNKNQRRLDYGDKAKWQRIALELFEAGASGTWLRHAEARVAAALAAARVPAPPTPPAPPLPEPSAERLNEVHAEIQRRADLARARMRKEAS